MKTQDIRSGFTLVEMAVVLTIVAVLLAGMLPTITSQIEQQRRNETRKQMEEIRAALIGYALSQPIPKLPCPARPNYATGQANAGTVDCTIAPVSNTVNGVVPWTTLGTSETDAWGRRFTYSIASSPTGAFGTSFTLSSTGNIDVRTTATGVAIASAMPAVIVSHGTNGFGAWKPDGNQMLASPDLDELENSNANNTIFVSHDSTPAFDDLVVWISPNTLFNRLVAAGKLP
jgi:prepilin-type N-terminal cleavage/methylation domain-containing protein